MMFEVGMLVLGMLVWILGFAIVASMSFFALAVITAIYREVMKRV